MAVERMTDRSSENSCRTYGPAGPRGSPIPLTLSAKINPPAVTCWGWDIIQIKTSARLEVTRIIRMMQRTLWDIARCVSVSEVGFQNRVANGSELASATQCRKVAPARIHLSG